MKSRGTLENKMTKTVALFTRAWIEITAPKSVQAAAAVALFTRAWIEIPEHTTSCGDDDVALFTRAWIEIVVKTSFIVF